MIDDDEPLKTQTRIVQAHNGLYINLTKYGVDTGDIECGDELSISVFREGIVIPFNDE